MKPLTDAQRSLFYRIPHNGGLKQNGRARTMIKALQARGLIAVDVEVRPGSLHGRHSLIYTLTVLKCKHGRYKGLGSAACDDCFDETQAAKPRCPTCGRLT